MYERSTLIHDIMILRGHTFLLELMFLTETKHFGSLPFTVYWNPLYIDFHIMPTLQGTLREIVHGYLPEAGVGHQTGGVLKEEELRQLRAISIEENHFI